MKLPAELIKIRDETLDITDTHNPDSWSDGFDEGAMAVIETTQPILDGLLRNIALDWYNSELGKDERPNITCTGLPQKIYNQEMLNRLKFYLNEARETLQRLEIK